MKFLAVAFLVALTQLQSAVAGPVRLTPMVGRPILQTTAVSRSSARYNWIGMDSPLSGSVLVARAIREGRVRLPYRYFFQPINYELTCSPAPCRVPNVQASEGGSPVNETPITVDPHDSMHLLSGGNDYNCPNVQGFYASSDGGTHWNHTCLGNISGGSGDGDPGVAYDPAGGAYITGIDELSSTVSDIAFERSKNNGRTWSQPAIAVTGISPYTFSDKDWLQIDDSPSSPRIGDIYISTTGFDPSSNSIIAVAHSTDGGNSWKNVMVDAVNVPEVDQFSDLAISDEGILYVSWMRCSATGPNANCGQTKAALYIARSSDGGVTWSKPVKMVDANLAPDPCGAYYGCLPNTDERVSDIPAIDVDRSSGAYRNRVYAIYYNWDGTSMRVMEVWSSDRGAHWSRPVEMSDARNDEFFPWLTTARDGTVGATWLDRRRDPSNLNYDAFAATSTDGGDSFPMNVRLSTVSSNPLDDGFGGSFMGDYTGNIWDDKTLYQSWTDTRSMTNGQDEIGGLRL
jgi:hypothetical protein